MAPSPRAPKACCAYCAHTRRHLPLPLIPSLSLTLTLTLTQPLTLTPTLPLTQETLLTLLEAFVYDPLVDWAADRLQ
eukprot:scaffold53392_cov24-Phaeocystis_antarctica.AAC.2